MQCISGRSKDLGDGFVVKRVLPHAARRSLGPFVFIDEMGPVTMAPGQGFDVRPHPHIGLCTLTYLLDGVVRHRDSLGVVQDIRPRAVNWMTAGRGIVHSERRPEADRQQAGRLHGLQVWVALPERDAECAPAFQHVPKRDVPAWRARGVDHVLVAGSCAGRTGPVAFPEALTYLHLKLSPGASWTSPGAGSGDEAYGVYLIAGEAFVNGRVVRPGTLAIPEGPAHVEACGGAGVECVYLGGRNLDGPRILWWNFVARSESRMQRAMQDWARGAFAPVPGETEFIPLPPR